MKEMLCLCIQDLTVYQYAFKRRLHGIREGMAVLSNTRFTKKKSKFQVSNELLRYIPEILVQVSTCLKCMGGEKIISKKIRVENLWFCFPGFCLLGTSWNLYQKYKKKSKEFVRYLKFDFSPRKSSVKQYSHSFSNFVKPPLKLNHFK